MKKIFPIISFCFLCSICYAQQAATNNGNMQVFSGGSIAFHGNLTNASSAALVNNGSLHVKGNLTNNQSSMSSGSGTLYLNGSSSQSVGGSQPFKTYNLETNNSAGITLNADLSVSGTHTFSSGLITTSSIPNYLIYESGSSHSGSADSKHVNGWVKKIGNSNFTFPVGDATYERSIAVTNLSASSEFNCKYNTPTSNIYNLFSPLVKVKANEFWQLDQVSGGTAQVTLNWDHSKVAMDNVLIADILSSLYTGGNWTSTSGTASGNVTTTGTITSNATGTFGPFTFGYKSFPVPLKLLSFSAVRRTGTSYLNWVTENEYNVDHFDVQRSYNGISFINIGNTAARNNNSRETYYFEDHSALNGLAYYRIKSVDVDGKFSYSRIVVLYENDLTHSGFTVLNPARDFITILNKSMVEGVYNYRLYNAGGQMVTLGTLSMSAGGGAVLPLPSSISAGTYFIDLSNDIIQFKQKVLIEK